MCWIAAVKVTHTYCVWILPVALKSIPHCLCLVFFVFCPWRIEMFCIFWKIPVYLQIFLIIVHIYRYHLLCKNKKKIKMTEAHDENSINTDITFESGDENVRIPRILISKYYIEISMWSFFAFCFNFRMMWLVWRAQAIPIQLHVAAAAHRRIR